jgi:hypothetical protein
MNRIVNRMERTATINEHNIEKLFNFFDKNKDSKAMKDFCMNILDDNFLWDDYFASEDSIEEESHESLDGDCIIEKVVNTDYYSENKALKFFLNDNISYAIDDIDNTLDEMFELFPADINKIYVELTDEEKRKLVDEINTKIFEKEKGSNPAIWRFIVNHCSSDDFDELYTVQLFKYVTENSDTIEEYHYHY